MATRMERLAERMGWDLSISLYWGMAVQKMQAICEAEYQAEQEEKRKAEDRRFMAEQDRLWVDMHWPMWSSVGSNGKRTVLTTAIRIRTWGKPGTTTVLACVVD